MRLKIINFFRKHEKLLSFFYFLSRCFWNFIGLFTKINKKQIIFASFGGRKFDDSPKAIYDAIIHDSYFDDYKIIWAFVNPDEYSIERGVKVKIDTFSFFKTLLKSQVWISNTGIDRGIGIKKKNVIRVETWHGCPLKKICGEEAAYDKKRKKKKSKKLDTKTIRCAQGEYDLEILARVFNADKKSFIVADLPRNDELCLTKTEEEINAIKERVGIKKDDKRKILLYTPTYREFLQGKDLELYLAPPMTLTKWEEKLGKQYILLFRAHYAVTKVMGIKNNDFIKDVSNYDHLNDLYFIADCMLSDYSSSFIDYSILGRPMFCFAYDLEEYIEKRGLYIDLESTLPCKINRTEDDVINDILSCDYKESSQKTNVFRQKFVEGPGLATSKVVGKIKEKLSIG